MGVFIVGLLSEKGFIFGMYYFFVLRIVIVILDEFIEFFYIWNVLIKLLDVLIVSIVFDLRLLVVFIVINDGIYIVYDFIFWLNSSFIEMYFFYKGRYVVIE